MVAYTDENKFVRTANYFLLSGPRLEETETLKSLSRFDLIVLPAEAQVFNKTFFTQIRKLNPDIIILAYVPTVSFNHLYWSDALHIKLKKGIRAEWWLQDGNGNPKSIWPNTSALNLSSGWNAYLASFVSNEIMSTGLWDGVFYDEVSDEIAWISPIDINRDGAPDVAKEANENWEQSYISLFSQTRSLIGNEKIIITNGSSKRSYTPYVNGRMFESFPTPWEGDGGWQTVMKNYLSLEHEVKNPSIFFLNGDTQNKGFQNDYQKVRFGITSTLLGNGYFGFDFGTENHAQLWEYDEYQIYLGKPKEDISHTIKNGVWQRNFENGKVVVNATSKPQTIQLDGEYEKIHGTQDPKTNNGSIVSKIHLLANDGIILLRPVEKIEDNLFLNGSFVRIFNQHGKTARTGFFTYDPLYRGGQRMVYKDLDGDGRKETIVANQSKIEIYKENGELINQFYPYTQAYHGGINFALADLDQDGTIEIITGTNKGGGPQVRIFNKDGVLIHPGFFAYDPQFRGGISLAIGDLNGDNINEIIVGAGEGGGPHVRVFNKDGKLLNPGFFAYDPQFRGGVHVAAGDINGDGKDEIITGPGIGGGPHVRVFNKDSELLQQFFAFESSQTSGVDVTVTDLDTDGIDEIIGISNNVFTFSVF